LSKKYYKTVFTVEVLSEDPVPFDLALEDLAHEIVFGDYSGKVTRAPAEELASEQMTEALESQGSDPGFFGPHGEQESE
jgi:hypothetical protein